jgi:hypothetical protein
MVLVGGRVSGFPLVARVIGCFLCSGPGLVAGLGGIGRPVRRGVLLVMAMLMFLALRHPYSSLLFGPAQSAPEQAPWFTATAWPGRSTDAQTVSARRFALIEQVVGSFEQLVDVVMGLGHGGSDGDCYPYSVVLVNYV